MSKTRQLMFALGATMFSLTAAHAQQRSIDMEPILTSPATGTVITTGDTIQLQISVKNNGTADLVQGDTLFLAVNIFQNLIPVVLTQGITSGSTGVIVDEPLPLSLQDPSQAVTADLCVTILDAQDDGITIGGVPVVLTYHDNDTSNNTTCNQITVNPEGGTAIASVNKDQEQLALYPNPASSTVSFSLPVDEKGEVAVSVTDITGREVLAKHNDHISTNMQMQLDVATLAPGMYMVKVTTATHKITGKLVIRR